MMIRQGGGVKQVVTVLPDTRADMSVLQEGYGISKHNCSLQRWVTSMQ